MIYCQNCKKDVSERENYCPRCCEEICTKCGCTDSHACPDGCYWVTPGLCSSCSGESVDDDEMLMLVEEIAKTNNFYEDIEESPYN